MTAMAARPLALARSEPTRPGDDRLERVRTLLRPEFLAEVWDVVGEVFAPPREHPLLGLRKCAVVGCEAGVRTPNTDLCKLCIEKYKASGLPMDQFTAIPANKTSKGEQPCRVPGCPRPAPLRVRLCHSHYSAWHHTGLSSEEFAASPSVRPLPSFGECLAASCGRSACRAAGLCAPHVTRWQAMKKNPGADFQRWLRVVEPVNADHFVIFKGLAERVQLELLLGLQLRADAGTRTLVTALRPVVAVLRQTETAEHRRARRIADQAQTRLDASVLGRYLVTAVQRATTTPDEERRKDVWDPRRPGPIAASFDFTPISQAWLRETAKRWAEEELPQPPRAPGRQNPLWTP